MATAKEMKAIFNFLSVSGLTLLAGACMSLAQDAAPARISASGEIDARMIRYPDVSQTQIVFVYAGDIWVAPRTGGAAMRLSSPKGEESFPRFSPDGAQIAFSGNYDGNLDIYVVPAAGGLPRRLTYHGDPDRMLELLAVAQDDDRSVTLRFAAGRAIRLEIGRLACHLGDVGEP